MSTDTRRMRTTPVPDADDLVTLDLVFQCRHPSTLCDTGCRQMTMIAEHMHATFPAHGRRRPATCETGCLDLITDLADIARLLNSMVSSLTQSLEKIGSDCQNRKHVLRRICRPKRVLAGEVMMAWLGSAESGADGNAAYPTDIVEQKKLGPTKRCRSA